MVSTVRRGRVTRLAVSAACLAIVVVAGAAPAVAAQPPAAGVVPPGGGYIAAPASVHGAQMKLEVPVLHCSATKPASVVVGLFGTIRSGTHLSSWRLVVVASCHRGTASYRGVQRDRFGRSTVLRVHAGDRVRLLKPDASSYEIDDLTSHASAGGGSASSPDDQPVLATPVFFGVQVNGTVPRAVQVHVLRARVNGTALNALTHHRQRQLNGHHVVVRAGSLHKDGAYLVTAW